MNSSLLSMPTVVAPGEAPEKGVAGRGNGCTHISPCTGHTPSDSSLPTGTSSAENILKQSLPRPCRGLRTSRRARTNGQKGIQGGLLRSSPCIIPGPSCRPYVPSPPAPGVNRSLHRLQVQSPQPLPWLSTGCFLTPSHTPLALSPNSYPDLEFFMGFYLVLTRLHGLCGPRFTRYLSPSQALMAGGPPAPQTPHTQSSVLLPREWASPAPLPTAAGPRLPSSPLPALRTLQSRVLGVDLSHPPLHQPPGSPGPRTKTPTSSHHILELP